MSKNVIFLSDGTWGNPFSNESDEQQPNSTPTNIYKLFLDLNGELSLDSLRLANEQEKVLSLGNVRQVAKYIHGVGDSRNPIVKLMGGAFGVGIISRIVRGYTFISRNYELGDRIYLIGFSRGSYTVRTLAGLILNKGLLPHEITQDQELAYRQGSQCWASYRQSTLSHTPISFLAEVIRDLPAFVSQNNQQMSLIPVDSIRAVAVFDTVGALGIPRYTTEGNRIDAFEFINTKLNPKVQQGFHVLALDEERCDFTPTLWDTADNVSQVVFPGSHGDVGGGYSETGLSDIALEWMIERLYRAGVAFSEKHSYPFHPSATAEAHKPWNHFPWILPVFMKGSRTFSQSVETNCSIIERMNAGNVVADPGEVPTDYHPTNLP